ncbi:hypothetical protein [Nocardia sp. NPDC052566]|uniref:hypothetical protein n=1 Tax=Nocardia sp. NPDC052566 TaxID=3364330 RepID=UPI0037CA18F7
MDRLLREMSAGLQSLCEVRAHRRTLRQFTDEIDKQPDEFAIRRLQRERATGVGVEEVAADQGQFARLAVGKVDRLIV